jgi:hypothetical protein
MEGLWKEKDGVLVAEEEVGLLRDAQGRILEWGTNEAMQVRPYLTVRSLLSEQEQILEKAVDGTLSIIYADKDCFSARIFSNSLFDAQGLGKIQLSKELRPDLETRARKITAFYVQLKMQK